MPDRKVILLGFALCAVCSLGPISVISGQDANSGVSVKPSATQLFELARSYEKDKKFDLAIETYREIVKVDPTNAMAYNDLGGVLAGMRRDQEALEAYRSAVKLAPANPKYQDDLGGGYINLHRWEEARAVLSEALRLDPTRLYTYYSIGILYDNTREFDKQLANNTKALELAPDNPALNANLGLTYMKLGRPADAVAPLERAIKIAPDYKFAWYHLSNAYRQRRRYKDAVDGYSKLLGFDPDDAEILIDRAWTYTYLGGSGREAAADAERYLKLYGWRTDAGPYQAIIAIIGHRSVGEDEQAAAILAQANKKADPTGWGFKLIQFIGGQMTGDELLSAAANNDQRTEAHAYIGVDLKLRNKASDARTHFEWVKEYGNRSFYEYRLALAELAREP